MRVGQMALEGAVIDEWAVAVLAFQVDPHFLMLDESIVGADVLLAERTRRHRERDG